MKIVLFLLASLFFGQEASQQRVPKKETVNIKMLKVERKREDRDGNLWYIIKITFRDSNDHLYRAGAECVTNPVKMSCADYVVPRPGTSASAICWDNFLFAFGEGAGLFEVESEEVADCK